MFTRRPSTFVGLLTGRPLVNKPNNLNVNYLKIPKKHRGPHKMGRVFEIPGLDWLWFAVYDFRGLHLISKSYQKSTQTACAELLIEKMFLNNFNFLIKSELAIFFEKPNEVRNWVSNNSTRVTLGKASLIISSQQNWRYTDFFQKIYVTFKQQPLVYHEPVYVNYFCQ